MPYPSLTDHDREEMCALIGVESAADLFADIPENLRATDVIGLGEPLSEFTVRARLTKLAQKNIHSENAVSFLGAGSYDHYVPAVVPAIVSRGELMTAYTPYQAETSQGTLQVIYEFQTLLCQLTAMEMANASLYDGATALAEAIIMAASVTKRSRVLLPRAVAPGYRAVAHAYTQGLPIHLDEVPFENGVTPVEAVEAQMGPDVAAVVVAHPNFFGGLEDVEALAELAHKAGALLIVLFNPISLGLLQAPGEYGADIAVAEGQPLGIASSFGGPAVGLFCCKKEFARLAPGRLVGTTVDGQGRSGFTLTLQTREQHIRREKATSNICTNQALCALVATVYLSAVGPEGLRQVAQQSYHKAHFAQELLAVAGVSPLFNAPFFHEWVVRLQVPVELLNARLAAKGILGGYGLGRDYPELGNAMLLCCTEKRTRAEIEALAVELSLNA